MENRFISQQDRLKNSKALREEPSMERVSSAAQNHSLEEGLEQGHKVRSKVEENWKKKIPKEAESPLWSNLIIILLGKLKWIKLEP